MPCPRWRVRLLVFQGRLQGRAPGWTAGFPGAHDAELSQAWLLTPTPRSAVCLHRGKKIPIS
eukprot:4787204-Pyramimonas_sp.AAC.1